MDYDGKRYVGLTLDWDYHLHKLVIYILGYILKHLLIIGVQYVPGLERWFSPAQ